MDAQLSFKYIEPPFNFNHPNVAKYPVEVTGNHLLTVMARRLGWCDLTGRKILDYGCGVRFARTIVNLGLDIGLYVGIDLNRDAINWLKANAESERLMFEHIDATNAMYNPGRSWGCPWPQLTKFRSTVFDVICMFSVITHQNPDEATEVFRLLRQFGDPGGPNCRLYFTAFLEEGGPDYSEGDPASPGLLSTYNPKSLSEIALKAGWRVLKSYPKAAFQQPAFIAEPV